VVINIVGDIDQTMVDDVYSKIINEYTIGDEVTIIFDSAGGYLQSAYDIIDLLSELPVDITALNTGDVMSAATLIWLHCDKRVWNCNVGDFLIHCPWLADVSGNSEELISYAIDLIQLEEDIKQIYSNIGKVEPAEFDKIMEEEKPMKLDEILKYRFATHIIR
jgi:ATP-dependent protease ClpP protease subunit